ncbi:VWA domain-containing protein [Candidatus Ozemobacteraceae bacterium]|nr:VWA domain-containing protein [Candidatus Ozemobacteraceae bacterium]
MVEVAPRTTEIRINPWRFIAFLVFLALIAGGTLWSIYSSSWGASNSFAEWLRKYLSVVNRFRPNTKPEDNLASALRLHGIEKLGEKRYAVLFTVTDKNGDPLTTVNAADVEVQLGDKPASRQRAIVDRVAPLHLMNQPDPVSFSGVMDYSGSMFPEDISAIESNYSTFLSAIVMPLSGSIVKFNNTVNTMTDLTASKSEIEKAVKQAVPLENTALYSGIDKGISTVQARRWMRFLLLTTDGNDNSSSHTLEEVLLRSRQHFVSCFTLGFGWLNVDILKRIAEETDGYYVYVPDSGELSKWFPKISKIVNNVQVAEVALPSDLSLPLSVSMTVNANGTRLQRSR